LLISILFFKETPNRIEFAGMAILVIGVLALLLAP
jgi:drug/metabolite transporter (DMT)-like permease